MTSKNLNIADTGRSVGKYLTVAGELLARGIETSGCSLFDTCCSIGNKLKLKPLSLWLGSLLKNSLSIVSSIFKSLFEITAGVLSGTITLILTLISWEFSNLRIALSDFVFPTAGAIVVIIGKILSTFQTLLFLQSYERPLSDDEKSQLKNVFHSSVNLHLIRIIEGQSGLFDLSPRAFTLGNTIYLKTSEYHTDLLVHETTHTWQYQHLGNRYTMDALTSQWLVDDAYNWFKEIDIRNKTDWRDFNLEAQAEFLEDIWKHGRLVDKDGRTIEYDKGSFYKANNQNSFGLFEAYGKNLTDLAQNTISQIRKRW